MSPRVRPRAVLGRVLLVGVLWLFGGGIGLVAGAAFVVYDLVSRPAPRDLLVLAVLLLGLVPLVVLARGLPAAGSVGPGFVEGNLAAHYLAGAGLALLVVGVLRETRAGSPWAEDPAAAGREAAPTDPEAAAGRKAAPTDPEAAAGREAGAGSTGTPDRHEHPALPAPPEERR
jgi:hypothetical protein